MAQSDAILFRPKSGDERGGMLNALRLATYQEVAANLSVRSPIPMPLDEGHLTMAFAYALAACGIHIGMGEGEVAPDKAMEALVEGLQRTRPDAMRDIRERLAQYAEQTVSSAR